MKKRLKNITDKSAPVISLAIIVLLWLFISEGGLVPAYMLPTPVKVIKAFIGDFPLLLKHAETTLWEAFFGLLAGTVLGFIIAVLMDRFRFLNKALYPVLVVTQTVPTIAIAPLLILWMGFSVAPKITLVIITTFFPVAISLLDGFKSADKDAIMLLKSMGAKNYEVFKYIKLPSALPSFFSGLKVSSSYAIVGAVIAEWLGGFEGLGVYMTRVKEAYAYDKMFAVIIFICVLSLVLMGLVSLISKLAMPWNRKNKNE